MHLMVIHKYRTKYARYKGQNVSCRLMDNYSTTFYTLEQGFPTIFHALTQNNFYILRNTSLLKRLQARKM
jgi:hypothetical protein